MIIWDTFFKKPDAVMNTKKWVASLESQSYLLYPDCLLATDGKQDSLQRNSIVAGTVLVAYKNVCKKRGDKPRIKRQEGTCYNLLSLSNSATVTHDDKGNTILALANSELIDFDDSDYKDDLLEEMNLFLEEALLDQDKIHEVVAKAERILTGHTDKITNTEIMLGMLEAIDNPDKFDVAQIFPAGKAVHGSALLLGIASSLASQGFILQYSEVDFLQAASSLVDDKYMNRVQSLFRICLDDR